LIELEQAIELALEAVKTTAKTSLESLFEANGRIIARDYTARYNQPPFDRSAVDGYALSHADLELASRGEISVVPVSINVFAGDVEVPALRAGTAARIMTGAMNPRARTVWCARKKPFRKRREYGFLGADPTPMNFSEVYTALQLKTIDAQENPVEVPLANKFFEVQDYLSLTNHIADSFGIFINKNVWNSFDVNTQKLIKEAAVEAADYKNRTDIAEEEKIIKELEANGMKVNRLTEAQIKMFQAEAMKLYPTFGSGADR
jgi:hypothetical protein